METTELQTVYNYNLQVGTNSFMHKVDIPIRKNITHKLIEDNCLDHNGKRILLVSSELAEILKLYDKSYLSTGQLIIKKTKQDLNKKDIPWRSYNFSSLETTLTEIRPVTYTYNCNPKEIFKPIRELKQTLLASASVSLFDGDDIYSPSIHNLLIALSFNDAAKARVYLRRYKTLRIIKELDKPFFKHVYKILHPNTEFIKHVKPEK